jgi:DNA-directed RNA polymerase subunit F
MGELKIVEESPITLTELQDKLKKIEKRDGELSFRGNKTKEYLGTFVTTKPKEIQELRKKLEELNVPRLKDRHITKIIDIMPEDLDSMKILLSGEAITIKEDDMKKIIAALK